MKHILYILLLCSILSCQQNEDIEKEVTIAPEKTEEVIGPVFDHYAIIVADLERASRFYMDVVGLKEIHDATEKGHIRWFGLGKGASLHVIQSEEVEQIKVHKPVHLSLAVADLDEFINNLESSSTAYENWPGTPDSTNVRPDGVTQIYFQDPDGYWIEVNDAVNFR